MNANQLIEQLTDTPSVYWTAPGATTFTAHTSKNKPDAVVIKALITSRTNDNKAYRGTGLWWYHSGDAGFAQACTDAVREARVLRAHAEKLYWDDDTQEWT